MKIIYMWTAVEETNIKTILADTNTTELVVKIRTENNSEPRGHERSWVRGHGRDHGFKSILV